ncbi:Probable RNA-directed DNA polymerase from transposon BS [Eumeta japonica]|uniref:Probable RNA-directed DNA polymerase from transposon BS n=1 Tax=Eumeta variegata TaxID=151549 RepID=A0A4C1Z0D8_EUMVA|nr:Probable RNA-directed DNA polymerase from transposon BS [Eumeta japonica]
MKALAKDRHFNIVTSLIPTHFPNNDNYMPDILDIAFMKGVALKLSYIETLQCLNSDHRPVLMRTVVESSTRVVPAKFDHKELPSDVSELIREKNTDLRRVSKYPTCEKRSHARALLRSGRDSISSVALLVVIFNACIRNCYFPAAWKEAVVIDIPKPGKPRDLPASYRLSLLSVLEYISEDFKVERKTVAVFIDVAKAFDRVWHAGLIYKLYQLELPDRLVNIIHHYISNRHFSFRLDNIYSSMRPIRVGVPQDSKLSPLLYSAYVNDIPRPSTGVQLALLADDTAFYLRSNYIGNILPMLQRVIEKSIPFNVPWYVKNSVLHRHLEHSDISKFMKDVSERFFDIASNHPNPLLVSAVSYRPYPPHHFCKRPRNVLLDPPDDLTVEVEKLLEGSHAPTATLCRNGRISDEGVKALVSRQCSHKLFRRFLVRTRASVAVVLQPPHMKLDCNKEV